MSQPSITVPANGDYESFFHGHQVVDHPKKRAISLILAIVAGFLLYVGTKTEPIDEKMTYAGVLTLIYLFVGRNFMFKVKVKGLWKQRTETNPELKVGPVGVTIIRKNDQQTLEWSDFGFYNINENAIFLHPIKTPNHWITVSMRQLDEDEKIRLLEYIKTNIVVPKTSTP